MGGCVSTADDHPQSMPSLPQIKTQINAAKMPTLEIYFQDPFSG